MNQNESEWVFFNAHLLKLRLPFMVESVSAVDGSNLSEVIEEVGADGALCSDGHLRRSRCSNWYKEKICYCFCRHYSLGQTPHMCTD